MYISFVEFLEQIISNTPLLIITVLINVFYMGNGTNQYGNRLEGIEEVKLTNKFFSVSK